MSREAVLQLLLREAHEGVRGRWSRGAADSSAGCLSFRSLRPAGTVCHGSSASSGCNSIRYFQDSSQKLSSYQPSQINGVPHTLFSSAWKVQPNTCGNAHLQHMPLACQG